MRNFITFGADEAGLGPWLGPLAVTMVGFETVDKKRDTSIEQRLFPLVRKDTALAEVGLSVDDSKVIYRAGKGFGQLERTALAFWYAQHGRLPRNLGDWIERSALSPPDLGECPWYGPAPFDLELPRSVEAAHIERCGEGLRLAMNEGGIQGFSLRQRIVTAPALNRMLGRLELKSEVLADTLAGLVREAGKKRADLAFHIDKLGGRNYYAPLLQRIFPQAFIIREHESRARSSYRFDEAKRKVRVGFHRKGDRLHMPIALASMLSKYMRELFMHLFNRYWQGRLPRLKATAGYPRDAARFIEEIRASAGQAGLDVSAFRRAK
jgi:ribonuclease HII